MLLTVILLNKGNTWHLGNTLTVKYIKYNVGIYKYVLKVEREYEFRVTLAIAQCGTIGM